MCGCWQSQDSTTHTLTRWCRSSKAAAGFAEAEESSRSRKQTALGSVPRRLTLLATAVGCIERLRSRLNSLPGNSDHGRCAALDVIIRGRPTGYADTHGCLPMPLCASAPAGAVVLHSGDHAPRLLITAKGDHYLVQHHVVEDAETRLAQQLSKQPCLATVSLDEFAQPAASQGTHGRPHFHAACAPRSFGGEQPGLSARSRCKVSSANRHGSLEVLRLPHDCHCGIIGNVQPFMTVDGPRVGGAGA